MILSYIFCFIIGILNGCLISSYLFYINFKKIYGIIEVDDESESYFFKMNSDKIKNVKNKQISFKIIHKNNSQK